MSKLRKIWNREADLQPGLMLEVTPVYNFPVMTKHLV